LSCSPFNFSARRADETTLLGSPIAHLHGTDSAASFRVAQAECTCYGLVRSAHACRQKSKDCHSEEKHWGASTSSQERHGKKVWWRRYTSQETASVQTWHSGTERDQEVSKEYRLVTSKTPLFTCGTRNHDGNDHRHEFQGRCRS